MLSPRCSGPASWSGRAQSSLSSRQSYELAALLSGSDGQESAWNAGDLGSISGSGRSPGEGNGNPLQYSCLENPHGQRSLVEYSSWGCKESDRTERITFSLSWTEQESSLHAAFQVFWKVSGWARPEVICAVNHLFCLGGAENHFPVWQGSLLVVLTHLPPPPPPYPKFLGWAMLLALLHQWSALPAGLFAQRCWASRLQSVPTWLSGRQGQELKLSSRWVKAQGGGGETDLVTELRRFFIWGPKSDRPAPHWLPCSDCAAGWDHCLGAAGRNSGCQCAGAGCCEPLPPFPSQSDSQIQTPQVSLRSSWGLIRVGAPTKWPTMLGLGGDPPCWGWMSQLALGSHWGTLGPMEWWADLGERQGWQRVAALLSLPVQPVLVSGGGVKLKHPQCVLEFPQCCFVHEQLTVLLVVVQSLSRLRLFATTWTIAWQASLVHHYLLEFAQTHVHWVSDAI